MCLCVKAGKDTVEKMSDLKSFCFSYSSLNAGNGT